MEPNTQNLPIHRRPIAVFDSGVGGLSILREIKIRLPFEDLIFFADQANVPYGQRTLTEVRAFSVGITKYLLRLRAKLIVVACNTASAAALHNLREQFPTTPFVGMEPAVKPAAALTKTKRVAILATPATFQGKLYASVVERFAEGVEIIEVVLPGLVEQIEAGELSSDSTRGLLEQHLTDLRRRQVDAVVLACTHYPFVIPLMEQILGPQILVLDPSPAIARQTERVLEEHGWLTQEASTNQLHLVSTRNGNHLQEATKRLIGVQGMGRSIQWGLDGELLSG
jgi:glutamate racemase